jgi:hypothetical protein
MARARNIKPAIMDNEGLADLEPLTRLLFVYLWMLADREGRLEDRPKRIAAQAFPYDRAADVDAMLNQLVSAGFIVRYEVQGLAIIQIVNFLKHQTPHGTERDSELPDEDGFLTVHKRTANGYATGEPDRVPYVLTVKTPSPTKAGNGALTVKAGSRTALDNSATAVNQQSLNTLIPDSGLPDSLIPEIPPQPPKGGRGRRKPLENIKNFDGFERWYALYRRKDAKKKALAAWVKLDPDELTQAQMIAAVKAWPWPEDRSKIPLPASWINGERWKDESVVVAVSMVQAGPAAADLHGIPSTSLPWWMAAGFDHPDEAANFGCREWNAKEFRDGKRIDDAGADR